MKRQALFFFSLFFISLNLNAQLTLYNKEIKTGPVFGFQKSNIQASTRSFVQQRIEDQISGVSDKDSWGVHAGVVFLMELDNQFALRGNAIISYQRNEIYFDLIGQEDHTEIAQPVTLEFPIHLVYSGDRNKNIVPSIALGFNYMRDISFYKNKKLFLEKNDLGVEAATGFLINFKKYKIHPEILVSVQGVGQDGFHFGVHNRAVRGFGRQKFYFRISLYRR